MNDGARVGGHALVIKRAEPLGELTTEKQVRRCVKIVGKREILIERLDPKRAGIARAVDRSSFALDEDLATVGSVRTGQDLD